MNQLDAFLFLQFHVTANGRGHPALFFRIKQVFLLQVAHVTCIGLKFLLSYRDILIIKDVKLTCHMYYNSLSPTPDHKSRQCWSRGEIRLLWVFLFSAFFFSLRLADSVEMLTNKQPPPLAPSILMKIMERIFIIALVVGAL